MKPIYLDFEAEIAELEKKIEELRFAQNASAVDISEEIAHLEKKVERHLGEIYAHLTPWQVTQVARHPHRPYALDYIEGIFTDFTELHGDRAIADDVAVVGGLARFEGVSAVVIGQQKGREIKEKVARNFGMPRPEGYRKALRLAKMAEKFSLPLITFVDTPGAYPGIDAEERNQSEAIARNLFELARLATPIVTVVIGEGGSGGALALAVADKIYMLQYAIYSVISPEGCASILWKSASEAPQAAERLGLTAPKLKELNLIDDFLPEPLGGAHRHPLQAMEQVRGAIRSALAEIGPLSTEDLLSRRDKRLMAYGRFAVP